jgi:hypothetical protein
LIVVRAAGDGQKSTQLRRSGANLHVPKLVVASRPVAERNYRPFIVGVAERSYPTRSRVSVKILGGLAE